MHGKTASIRDLQEKAFRIASAIFRFAQFLSDDALSPILRRQAARLVDAVAAQEKEAVDNALRAIGHLTQLGSEAGMITGSDADVLMRALRTYEAELALGLKTAQLSGLNLETVLQEKEKNLQSGNPATASKNPATAFGNPAIRVTEQEEETPQQHEERKKLMFEKIRQSGNTRLKELQDTLPDVSERTIRYDLKKLLEEGKIERVGSGGAGSYYRVSSQISTHPVRETVPVSPNSAPLTEPALV